MPLSLFVDPQDSVTVKFVVAAKKGDPSQIYCEVDEKTLKEVYEDVDEATIEAHEAEFRLPTFEDQSKMQDAAIEMTSSGLKANVASIQMARISQLLKRWTLTPKANPDEVKKLRPVIALVISSELDRLL